MFSLIIPVYKNEANIPPLLAAVQDLRDRIEDDFEVIFVVDGSPDRSYLVLKESLPATGLDAQLIALSRNFGSLAAIRAGLERARGDAMAVMAADLPGALLYSRRTVISAWIDPDSDPLVMPAACAMSLSDVRDTPRCSNMRSAASSLKVACGATDSLIALNCSTPFSIVF